jgi:hypothetical protein
MKENTVTILLILGNNKLKRPYLIIVAMKGLRHARNLVQGRVNQPPTFTQFSPSSSASCITIFDLSLSLIFYLLEL